MKTNKFAGILFFIAALSLKTLACSLVAGANPNTLPERQSTVLMFLAISLFFAAGTFFLYFKKSRQGIISVIVSFVIVGFSILTSDVYMGDCGKTALYNAKIGVSITFVCFLAQFTTWLLFRNKNQAELP
jgi:hypothetical protein